MARNALLVPTRGQGRLVALNKSTGGLLWALNEGTQITSTPWITSKGEIVVASEMRRCWPNATVFSTCPPRPGSLLVLS